VVHAQWTQIPFTVSFEEHGGTAVPDSTFVSGGTLALPAEPTRAGYTFNGWFTAQTGGTKYGSIASPPDGNLVVHAQWTAVAVVSAPTTTVPLPPATVSAAEVVLPEKEITPRRSLPQTGTNMETFVSAALALLFLGVITVNSGRLRNRKIR
jgi:uncharacterized repeat protein (TIGR02543 family)